MLLDAISPVCPCLSDSTNGNLISPGLGQTKTAKAQEGPVEGGWGALPAFGWGRADRLVQPGEGPMRLPWLPEQARHGTRWAGQPLWRRGTAGQHHGTPGAGSLPSLPLVPLQPARAEPLPAVSTTHQPETLGCMSQCSWAQCKSPDLGSSNLRYRGGERERAVQVSVGDPTVGEHL